MAGSSSSNSSSSSSRHQPQSSPSPRAQPREDVIVAKMLEIARDSAEGAMDPTVNRVLESALDRTWSKVKAQPDSYVMTRDEFAIFNYFQQRFAGDKIATAARKRYWDSIQA